MRRHLPFQTPRTWDCVLPRAPPLLHPPNLLPDLQWCCHRDSASPWRQTGLGKTSAKEQHLQIKVKVSVCCCGFPLANYYPHLTLFYINDGWLLVGTEWIKPIIMVVVSDATWLPVNHHKHFLSLCLITLRNLRMDLTYFLVLACFGKEYNAVDLDLTKCFSGIKWPQRAMKFWFFKNRKLAIMEHRLCTLTCAMFFFTYLIKLSF